MKLVFRSVKSFWEKIEQNRFPTRPRGAFRGPDPPPQITACASSCEKCAPSEDWSPKESNRSGATGVHFWTCAPLKYWLCSARVSEVSFQDENTIEHQNEAEDCASKTYLLINLFTLVFNRWICGQEPRFAPYIPSRPASVWMCPPSKNCTTKGGKRPISTRSFGMMTFLLVFKPKFEEKFICAPPKYFSAPPLPSHATLAPGLFPPECPFHLQAFLGWILAPNHFSGTAPVLRLCFWFRACASQLVYNSIG